jgi:hypothetical protein
MCDAADEAEKHAGCSDLHDDLLKGGAVYPENSMGDWGIW